MSDDEIEVEEVDASTDIVVTGSVRAMPSQLRGHPLHVEPVSIELTNVPADDGAEVAFEELRRMLLERWGFAPRELHVAHIADASRDASWRLLVHGEPVDRGALTSTDIADVTAAVGTAVERHLHAMLGIDDVVDLVEYARVEAPVAIDRLLRRGMELGGVQVVLQELLRDGVPIKPLAHIAELLTRENPHEPPAPAGVLVERVRMHRARSLVDAVTRSDGSVRVLRLAPEAEDSIRNVGDVDPSPSTLRRVRLLCERLDADIAAVLAGNATPPVVVACRQETRPVIARVLRRSVHHVTVLGDGEIERSGVDVRVVATIGVGIRVAPSRRHPVLRQQVATVTAVPGDDWLNGEIVEPVDVPHDAAGWNW